MKRYDERCCSGVTGWDRVMWDLVICRWWQKLADFSEPKCWIMHCYTLLGLLPCKYLCVFDTTREALWVDLFSWGTWHGDVLQLSQDTRKQPPPGNWVCKACCDKTLTASEDIDLPALLNVYGCTSSMLNGKTRSFFEDLVCCVCVLCHVALRSVFLQIPVRGSIAAECITNATGRWEEMHVFSVIYYWICTGFSDDQIY